VCFIPENGGDATFGISPTSTSRIFGVENPDVMIANFLSDRTISSEVSRKVYAGPDTGINNNHRMELITSQEPPLERSPLANYLPRKHAWDPNLTVVNGQQLSGRNRREIWILKCSLELFRVRTC
jgi:hypothetical protein